MTHAAIILLIASFAAYAAWHIHGAERMRDRCNTACVAAGHVRGELFRDACFCAVPMRLEGE